MWQKNKAPILAEPSLAELYLETYKKDPEKKYKTNRDEQLEKYVSIFNHNESFQIRVPFIYSCILPFYIFLYPYLADEG